MQEGYHIAEIVVNYNMTVNLKHITDYNVTRNITENITNYGLTII